jgi:hypothetical protein
MIASHLRNFPDSNTKGQRNIGATPICGTASGWHRHTSREISHRPPSIPRGLQPKVGAAPRQVREIAWKAQTRLCGRFRSLIRKGKLPTVVATAIARELSAFIWAINREVMARRQA